MIFLTDSSVLFHKEKSIIQLEAGILLSKINLNAIHSDQQLHRKQGHSSAALSRTSQRVR